MSYRRFIILESIDALAEVVSAINETRIARQSVDHANKLFLDVVKNQEELWEFLIELTSLTRDGKLSQQAARKIISHVAHLMRQQIVFDEACLAILDRFGS
jgi:hypothetical protein